MFLKQKQAINKNYYYLIKQRNTKEDVGQDEDGKDVPKLESVEVALVHCNLFNNNYQQASKVSFSLVPNKQFG